MKTIFKILMILVAAVLVGGLLYGAVTVFSSDANQTQLSDGSANGQFPSDGELTRPSRDDESSEIQFPVDSIKNLVIITMIGVLYLNTSKIFRKRKPTLETS